METTDLELINDQQGSEHGALEQISRAEIDSQIATAKKYPRNIGKVRQQVLSLATMDEETAQDCFFSIPRGGKVITGESVRFAEILAASYGNIKAAWRPVGFDRQRGVVTCQGVCIDLENNVSTSLEKTRQVQKKRGATTYDEDMVTLATNSCGAVAYRDAVFKTIPKAIVKSLLPKIKEAARGEGTLEQKVTRILNKLSELGAEHKELSKKQVYERVLAITESKTRDDIDLAKLDILIGLATAIRDGEVHFDTALPDPKKSKQSAPDAFSGFSGKEEEGEADPAKKQATKTDDGDRKVIDEDRVQFIQDRLKDEKKDEKWFMGLVKQAFPDCPAKNISQLTHEESSAAIAAWEAA